MHICPCNVHSYKKSFNEQTNYHDFLLLLKIFLHTTKCTFNVSVVFCHCKLNFPWKFPCFLQKKKVMCNIKQNDLHFVRLQKKKKDKRFELPYSVKQYFLTKFVLPESVMDDSQFPMFDLFFSKLKLELMNKMRNKRILNSVMVNKIGFSYYLHE